MTVFPIWSFPLARRAILSPRRAGPKQRGGAPVPVSVRDLGQPALEKPPLRLQPREAEGTFVGGAGVHRPPQSPAQVCPSGVGEMIIFQIATRQDRINQREASRGAVAHRHRHGAVQLDDG